MEYAKKIIQNSCVSLRRRFQWPGDRKQEGEKMKITAKSEKQLEYAKSIYVEVVARINDIITACREELEQGVDEIDVRINRGRIARAEFVMGVLSQQIEAGSIINSNRCLFEYILNKYKHPPVNQSALLVTLRECFGAEFPL
jgi:hypothetical protein